MVKTSIRNTNSVIKEFEKQKNIIEKAQTEIKKLMEGLTPFLTKYKHFFIVEKEYDDDYENVYNHPLIFIIHKNTNKEDIKLLNSIFLKNKKFGDNLYISLNYDEYGRLISEHRWNVNNKEQSYDIPHVYTYMYPILIKACNEFMEIKNNTQPMRLSV